MRKAPGPVTTEEVLPALLRQRFDLFVRYVFREVLGSREFVPGWHLDAIQFQLERMLSGENSQLIVTIPPRHLKSIMISVAWVAWVMGRYPQTRFTCVSYDLDLAEKHARDCLKVVESAWYRKAFPNMRLTKRSMMDFETYAGGGRLAGSINGGITGRGGDWIIIDDPMQADDALSETMRMSVYDWFSNTLRQRADNDRTRYILLMQRLHEDDLAGHLLREGGWEELRLSAIATEDQRVPLTRGRFHQRREGHVLTPRQHSLAYLERRRALEPYVFAAQHQQEPMSRIGAFVQPEWFPTYDEVPRGGIVIQSWDTAVKATVRSDWSVGITALWFQGHLYTLDVYRKRVEFGDLIDDVRMLCERYDVTRLLIEDASSGHQLIQQLQREAGAGQPYPIAVSPTQDKLTRFEARASQIRGGQVLLPRNAPWLADFVEEVTKFPGGRHDDQADALAQMLANLPPAFPKANNAGPEIVEEGDSSRRNRGDEDYEDDGWGG